MRRPGIMRLLAAAALTAAATLPGAPARADAVTEWNVIALNATALPPNSILQSRALAIVHAAIYDAVRAVEPTRGAYAVEIDAPAGTSIEAAVVAAAHAALVRVAPAQRSVLDAALNLSLAKIADGHGKTDGIALGTQIAERIVALRASDGADAKATFTPRPASVSTSRPRRNRCPRSCRNGVRLRRSCCAAGRASTSRAPPPPTARNSRATSPR